MTTRKDWDRGVMAWQARAQPPGKGDPHHIAMERYIERYPRGRARAGEDERPIGRTSSTTRPYQPTTRQNNEDATMVCSCGKTCKNERGLKIHQARMGCTPDLNLTQRTGIPGETEEETDQDANHSVRGLRASEDSEEDSSQQERVGRRDPVEKQRGRARVKWPRSGVGRAAWHQFDDTVDQVLESVLAGGVDKKVEAMTSIIYNVGAERCGTEERHGAQKPVPGGNSRRDREIGQIRGELRALTKQYRRASAEEKQPLEDLRHTLRERLKTLRRAECSRRKRKERARKRAQFTANPFQFASKLLGQQRSGRLECQKQEVEEHLRVTHSDPQRQEDLGPCNLLDPEEPSVPFNESEPKLKEVQEIVKKARAASAPGPNGVPYKVYKNCPKLTRRLWRLLKVVWGRGKMPDSWMVAEGCFIPKENSKAIKQFRTISLLNVEGKVFLSILARRMTSYMLANKYIDTSVQKGGIPGVSGCLEHTSVRTQVIQEAKENRGDLAVLWLDLANAYGSIPHKLVELTMQKYHVPTKTQGLLKHYFDHFKMRFTVGDFTTAWQRLKVGIVTGCTISVILFATAMNLLVKSAEVSSRGPVMVSGVRQPPTRAFMDDMTIMAKTATEARWMLQDLGKLIAWARMHFKPAKSRSLVLRKGKVQNRVSFKIEDQVIPTVSEQPVKSLGKWFEDSGILRV